MRFGLWIVGLLVIGMVGCSPAQGGGESGSSGGEATSLEFDLVGTEWRVEDLAGKGVIDFAQTTLRFGEDGQVTGSGGCNGFFGGYEVEGDRITFGQIASTMMACGEALMDQESRFLSLLAGEVRFEIDEVEFLILHPEEGEPTRLAPVTADEKPESMLVGEVIYRERIALPPDAEVTVRLVDVSKMDVEAEVLAETVIRPEGQQVPIPFELSYAPDEIDPRMRYAVQARITSGEELLFITTDVIPVLAEGMPADPVTVLVKSAR